MAVIPIGYATIASMECHVFLRGIGHASVHPSRLLGDPTKTGAGHTDMQRSIDRILTTHSGSIPRPPELHELLIERGDGELVDEDAVAANVRQSVHAVVRHQHAAGIDVVDDGEHSKIGFAYYLKDRLAGFELDRTYTRPRFPAEAADFPEYYTVHEGPDRPGARPWVCCVGPVTWKNFALVEQDIANLKDAAASARVASVFMTSPSPTTASGFQPNRYYHSDEEYTIAVADALKREYRAIVDAGIVLQVDMPFASARASEKYVGKPMSDVYDDVRKTLEHNIEVVNYALEGIPSESVRLHVCFGSDPGTHHRDPELGRIADILLRANVGGYTLVGASGRHEFEWRVFQDVALPEDKIVIAGVIDHTSNIIEHPQTVADRIVRWANVIGRERVLAGVDCGFSVTSGGERYRVGEHVMWAKFRSLAEGAAMASRELWK
jgi:5-methyltetrahydropteroyltriglutamate--homocysteine methyltransferase